MRTADETLAIAAKNDQLRTTGKGGTLFITAGIRALGIDTALAIMAKVIDFTDFGPDNDPDGRHDFGIIRHDGLSIYWKIDYYDHLLLGGENPLSPLCRRVLTVMLAEEY
jgi:hypothetical protein